MYKRVFASLFITVFAIDCVGCNNASSVGDLKNEVKNTTTQTETSRDNSEAIQTTKPVECQQITTEPDTNEYTEGLLTLGWNTSIDSIPEIDPSLDWVMEVNNSTYHYDKEKRNVIVTDTSGKMLSKRHYVSKEDLLYAKEEDQNKMVQLIIQKYNLPTEYTVETYTVEKSYKLGFIEKYKGDVSISIMGEGIGILVMNNN